MVLGKHNVRVRVIAGLIAQRLGNAVVAPVLQYVPEGAITPPEAHMRFAGTISISGATFESLLESSAKSFKQHGFRDIIFLGDHGGYQKNEVSAAQRINKTWGADSSVRATALTAYYDAAQKPFNAVLRSKGYTDQEIGTHAGLSDTSLTLATDRTLVRTDALAAAAQGGVPQGVYGDPRRSSAELGQLGVQLIVDASVRAIQDAVKQHAPP
jgi:creatinine amidohydrolase/Fe(II)-dependent formamide hydrolase-like protein